MGLVEKNSFRQSFAATRSSVQVLFYCCSWCFCFCLFVVVVVMVEFAAFFFIYFYLVTSLIIIPCGKFGCLTWLKEKSKVFKYAK